ncbi:MAG: chlorite dismutase family protein, partial [Candidatus Omnitrophica bacterium]|nr:chlorite dismutase family protein [Candidatus Omnitrophota bacterium]
MLQRQFVNFRFLSVLPAWRQLPPAERQAGKRAFVQVVDEYRKQMMIYTYATLGLKAGCDFLLWRIGADPAAFQEMAGRLLHTPLGAYVTVPHSFLSMTKRSQYIDKLDPDHQDKRLYVTVAGSKYLFVYPFVKTRDWYTLPLSTRQAMMDEHIK